MKIPNILTNFTKYEKIAIGFIIAVFLLFLIVPDFLIILFLPIIFMPFIIKSLFWCFSGHSIHTMGINFDPIHLFIALLVSTLFIILYYSIANRIFCETHKERKMLIGLIVLYLSMGFLAGFMGIGPH